MRKLGIKKPNKNASVKKKPSSLGDVLRDRSKLGAHDLREVWHDQKRLGKLEQKKFELKTKKISEQVDKIKKLSKFTKKRTKLKPKSNLKTRLKNKKLLYVLPIFVLIVVAGYGAARQKIKDDKTDLLGATSTDSASLGSQNDDLNGNSTNEEPDFNIYYPSGTSPEGLKNVTRKAPDGSIIYSYNDELDGIGIEVTQQRVPESIKSSLAIELEKIAKNFQATIMMQVDENTVYSGINEKSGTQTIITAKKDVLIFIKASTKIKEDSWVGYIAGLK